MSEVTLIEKYQNAIAHEKTVLEQCDEIIKLAGERRFKKVILEGFCRDEVVRYSALAVDPGLTQLQRDDAQRMAHAGGLLRRWIRIAEMQRETTLNTIREHEEELRELLHDDIGVAPDEDA